MSGQAAHFPGVRDQPIPIVAMAFQDLVAAHNGEMYRPGDGVFPPPGFQRELALNEDGADELGEAIARPIQTTLDRPQIAARDLRNLLIALTLELAEHENLTMMLGQPMHALVHRILQEPLAVQIIGTRGRVLELQGPVIGFPVLLDRLEQHEWVPATVPQLILRQVGRDRVDPGRELLCLIEPVQMAEHPNEDFLHQVFRAFAVADGTVYEIEETGLIAINESPESLGLTCQVPHHDLAVIELVQSLALERAWRIDGRWCVVFQRHPHRCPCVSDGNCDRSVLPGPRDSWHELCLPSEWCKRLITNMLRFAPCCERGILSRR